MSMSDRRRLLTTDETANLLGVSTDSVRRWADRGYLRAVRFGPRGRFRFPADEVARLSEGGSAPTSERIVD
jgi:excisionase family DNA binding protein